MAPPPALNGGYASGLFTGAQPSTVGFSEQAAFRHYLHALRCQVSRVDQSAFDAAVQAHQKLLDDAETVLQRLRGSNITGQLRDFSSMIDVNRAGLGLFSTLRGAILRRRWASI